MSRQSPRSLAVFAKRWSLVTVLRVASESNSGLDKLIPEQGANRGLGLGFVTQLLSRPEKYARVIAAARTYDSNDTESGLGKLVRESKGRLGVVRLEEVGEVESCLVSPQAARICQLGSHSVITWQGTDNEPRNASITSDNLHLEV